MPYEYAGDIKLTAIGPGAGTLNFCVNLQANSEDKWLKNVHEVFLEKDAVVQDVPVTFSDFFSHR